MNDKKLRIKLNKIRNAISIINEEINEIYNDNLEDLQKGISKNGNNRKKNKRC